MAFVEYLLMFALFLLAIFLIVLVLIQRGKGGGLAGALGGMGGQSAFGTKAGDLFTKITIVAAVAWIVLCIVSVMVLSRSGDQLNLGSPGPGQQQSQSTDGSDQKGAPSSTPAGGTESGGGTAPAAPSSSDNASKK
jgi:preprotein translocase subunit SecG